MSISIFWASKHRRESDDDVSSVLLQGFGFDVDSAGMCYLNR